MPEPPPEGVEAIEVTGEQLDVTDVQDEAQAISAFGVSHSVPGLHVGTSVARTPIAEPPLQTESYAHLPESDFVAVGSRPRSTSTPRRTATCDAFWQMESGRPWRDLPPNNLVFLIDVSGSMQTPAKLPLLKRSLRLQPAASRVAPIGSSTAASSDSVAGRLGSREGPPLRGPSISRFPPLRAARFPSPRGSG